MRATRRDGTTPSKREFTAGTITYALGETLRGPTWHGPSARAALRPITAPVATWRPAAGTHCIWELVLHMAYTRHRSLHRLGANPAAFPHRLASAWWPRMPEVADETAWAADVKLLFSLDDDLRRAIAALSTRQLAASRGRGTRVLGGELLGVALHDAYHTGQIRLLARMRERGLDA